MQPAPVRFMLFDAWDLLESGEADVVLTGAVNAADQYFLHAGFHQLMALVLTEKPASSGQR